jgi:hypothetical protein
VLPTIDGHPPDPLEAAVLQGSLDTFALPDVLVLLASTKKSGELRVAGHRGAATAALEGRMWFESGRMVAHDVLGAVEAADAVFELLRLTEGDFSFGADGAAAAPPAGAAEDIEPVLTEALARLTEWREIEKVVPSLSAWLELAPQISDGEVTLRADQWRLVVAVAGGRTVDSVLRNLERGELVGCRAVKEIIEAGLVVIHTDLAPLPRDLGTATVWADPAEDETHTVAAQLSALASEAAPGDEPPAAEWREELGEIPDLDALITIPPRRRRRTEAAAPDAEAAEVAAAEVAVEVDAPAPASPPAPKLAAALAAVAEPGQGPAAEAVADDLGVDLEGEGEGEDGDEPLNRGLLLKFLSSVRN